MLLLLLAVLLVRIIIVYLRWPALILSFNEKTVALQKAFAIHCKMRKTNRKPKTEPN